MTVFDRTGVTCDNNKKLFARRNEPNFVDLHVVFPLECCLCHLHLIAKLLQRTAVFTRN